MATNYAALAAKNGGAAVQAPAGNQVGTQSKYAALAAAHNGTAVKGGAAAAPANQPAPQGDFLQKASDALNTIFPAKNIGEAIGTELAKLFPTKNAVTGESTAKYVAPSTATLGGIAGDVAQNALLFAPVGDAAELAEKGIAAVAPKLAGGVAKTVGNVAAGAATGYGLDVANSASNNNFSLKPGLGTALGVAAPLVGPAVRGVGNLVAHSVGATTGVGADVIKTGYQAAREGGDATAAYKAALRGQTSPDDIVTSARAALKDVVQDRSDAYTAGLKKIQDETLTTEGGQTYVKKPDPENPGKFTFEPTTLSTKGVKDVATKTLKSIGLDAKGRFIDFRNRPSLDSKNIQKVHDFIYGWKDTSPVGLDQLRQEVAGFRKGGIQLSPSDNRFNTYIDNLTRNINSYVGDKVPQVAEMRAKYAQQSGMIKDIQKNLSLGKNSNADTAFRKLTSVLRTNNEFRAQFLNQLEDEAGRNLPQQIAGQQLSQILPRGIARSIDTAGGIGGLLAGVHILPLLSAAIGSSPRAVGELLLGLGFTARQANTFARAIGAKKLLFPAIGAINRSVNQ